MIFTEIALPTNNIALPIAFKSSLPEQKVNPKGYAVQQQKGFLFVEKTISLTYINLTLEEVEALKTKFSIKDPFTILTLLLFGSKSLKLAKPTGFDRKEYAVIVDMVREIRYDISFSCRVLS